ncbi:probable 1-acyl-sn-glycerol-3-phosphate acyltransferase 5 isoform X2 [Ziziphus jujuba]|uniref:1-acylglycerol-3-phosphate O-acyltransferase n=1 Tax=Ziziphus jujuba TaxID=326968 RepID=A0ABM3IXV1_ZIZJJ|nr:probable 1-acyl-sn-glycerol-3-phosphate acyltransferase 5 isoform X2 [Ziziphus jujuba]
MEVHNDGTARNALTPLRLVRALWPFLFEKINKTKVIFSGETVDPKKRILLIANHRTEVDWMYLWDLAWRKGQLGYIRYILKSSLMKLPIFGWSFQILEFIPVQRKWEVDGPIMHQMLSTFKDLRDPLWLALFPEGTDFTEQKCIRSQKYAAENGLPILNHVLIPKTKGFYACLEDLRESLDAVYDVTIGYKHRCPTFLDNAFGLDPSEVHMHVRRIPLDDIPTSEEKVTTWLVNQFHLKDELLSGFHSQGHFPQQGTEGELSTVKCLVNFSMVVLLTGICTYSTFFLSIWFKVYVSLVCAYLTSATYFNIQPLPIFHLFRAMFNGKSS